MNLWILNQYAVTPDMPGGTRHFDLSRELTEQGYDVTILASSFNHFLRREARLPSTETWRVEVIDGVRLVWLRTFPYVGNDWRRVVNMLSYMVRSYWVGRRLPQLNDGVSKPDVIIGSSVHLLAVLSGYLLARHFGAHFVMEVRDLWPQTLVDMGVISERHVLTRSLRTLERYLYGRAERIIVLQPRAGEYIASLGFDTDKVQWIPNGVDLSRFPKQPPRQRTDEQFTITYVGAHGQANGLDVILDVAREINQRGCTSVKFVLIGDGPEKPRLMAYSDELELPNVEFREPVAKTAIPSVLAESDALVLVVRDIGIYEYGISMNKLFDYMASGRPVVSASSAFNNVVESAQCCLTVRPEAPEELADAIINLREMSPAERNAMGERGYAHVQKHHDCRVLARRLMNLVEGLGREN